MPSLFLSVIAAGFVAFVIRWYVSKVSQLSDIPGPPPPSYIVGHIAELERARMGTKMIEWAKTYGQTYKIYGSLLEPWLILGDPRGVSHVLLGKNYVRPHTDRMVLETFFGKGLFCAEGEEHRRMRKSLSSAFTLQSIQETSHVFFNLAYNLKRQWEEILDGQEIGVIDIAPNIHMLALDAISMTMFMHNISAGEGNIPTLLHQITNSPPGNYFNVLMETLASMFPSILRLPSPVKRYADNSLALLPKKCGPEKIALGYMRRFWMRLTAGDTPVSKEEAVAQIVGIMFAGSETTANVISECLYELSLQPAVQQRLRTELMEFKSHHGKFPGFEDLMSASTLPYLDAVTRETMRTKAVLREVGRMALEDDVIPLEFPIPGTGQKEVRVKAGQVLQIPIRDGVNADEVIWGPDVSKFRPERWLEKGGLPPTVDLLHAQGHVLTFGDGTKACIGRTFAIAEFKIVISVVVCHFSFEDNGEPFDFYHLGGNTVKPKIRGREAEGVQLPLKVMAL